MSRYRFKEIERMSIVPAAKEWTRTSFTLPAELLADLEVLREEANADRPKPEKLSRDRFLQVCLEWVVREMREGAKKKGR